MKFSKWHGIGNDFIMIADPDDALTLSPDFVRDVCDRRFGVGGDGVIRVAPGRGDTALFMDYINSDGSIGEMCGNGIRCLALFAREVGLTDSDEIMVGTRAGNKLLQVLGGDQVRVDMGAPVFAPERIPVSLTGEDALHTKLDVDGEIHEAACLSMGNPHAVLFVAEPNDAPVTTLGPKIEVLDVFPNKANVEFAVVEGPDRVRMRVWERGSGETLACGTGACAVAVAARLLRDTDETVTVALPGGELEVAWSGSIGSSDPVYLTGPATKSFDGELSV